LLEVKRPGYTPSAVSPAQRDMHEALARKGFTVAIVTGQDEAVRALEAMGWVFR
jgi:phosphoglycolate phosphatase-like HAD superfamily hydrolase